MTTEPFRKTYTVKNKLTYLVAGLLLMTAVNLLAERGDVIPCRFWVDRHDPYVVINVEWKVEPLHAYQVQWSTDLKTWHDLDGYGFIAPEPTFFSQFDAVGFGGPDVYFFRLVDADTF